MEFILERNPGKLLFVYILIRVNYITSKLFDYFFLSIVVVIYDILNPKTHNGKWPEYINPKAVLIKGDVTDKISLTKAISGVDYIIHLAAEMDLNPDFQKFMDVNVGSTALIYEIIIKNNFSIKKVIVASSQFVYGEGKWECKNCGIFDAEIRSKNKMKNKEWDQTCPKCNKKFKSKF